MHYFDVYGPNRRFEAYGNVIPIFVFQILRGQPLTIFGDGGQAISRAFQCGISICIRIWLAKAPIRMKWSMQLASAPDTDPMAVPAVASDGRVAGWSTSVRSLVAWSPPCTPVTATPRGEVPYFAARPLGAHFDARRSIRPAVMPFTSGRTAGSTRWTAMSHIIGVRKDRL